MSDQCHPSPWLLVRTQPRREKYAQANIETWAKRPTYLPLIREQGQLRALFPSYIFVLSEQFHFLKGAWGVSHVVMVGSDAARVPEVAIAELKATEADRMMEAPPGSRFRKGDRIEVTRGVFEGFIGLYEGMDGSERVKVLLDILGIQTPTSIKYADIKERDDGQALRTRAAAC